MKQPRFHSASIGRAATIGGMPVPAFLRDNDQRQLYWRSWLETTILRDLARFFPRSFNPDFAFSLLEKIAAVLRDGELPTLKHFIAPAHKVRTYLSAMEDIFILRKMSCHESGTGKEVWLFTDSGLAAHLMGTILGEGTTLSLIRQFIWNEICAQAEYQGKHLSKIYFKSAQGSPIDFVLDNIPFRIVPSVTAISQRRAWEERPLLGAMKKLGATEGYLVGPVDYIELAPKGGGIGVLPWGAWS
jgi:predicted AAA+ superfamily ATPase